MYIPESNGHSPHSLGLEAVGLGNTSPVAEVQARTRSVEVLCGSRDEGVGVLGIDFLGGLANDVAVKEGHGLSEGDRADNKGDEEERVDSSHDKKAEVGVRPVVTNADHDVESGNASLGLVRVARTCFLTSTYHTERADELLWRLNTGSDDHLDEVGCNADDNDHADGLQNTDTQEHLAQGHGSIAWDRHFD